jgi:hypothetical protein
VTDLYSDKLKLVAPALKAMTITMSSVLTESSSGAFSRPPNRLRGSPGCGHWLTGITRTESPRTDMRATRQAAMQAFARSWHRQT